MTILENVSYEFDFDQLIQIAIIGGSIIAFLLIVLLFSGMLANPLKKCLKHLKKAQKFVIKVKSFTNEDMKYNNKAEYFVKSLTKELNKANRLSDAFMFDCGENDDLTVSSDYITRSINTLQLYRKYIFTKTPAEIEKMVLFVESSIEEAIKSYCDLVKKSKTYFMNLL